MVGRKIVGIVGMPGSGKTTAADVGRELGFLVVVMGDVVREEVARRGLVLSPENVGRVMLELREEGGEAVVAVRCFRKIAEAKDEAILIEGIRSLAEVEAFRRHFSDFKLLSIHSSPETRFRRIFERGRGDDPKNRQIFVERDERELKVGVGSAIAMADHMLANERSLKQFRAKARRFLEEYLRE